jgi:serine/threonine protein kinase
VYLATYKPSGQLLAVKMLDLDRCETQRVDIQLEELRREISVMSLSKHPNILRILTSFVEKDKLWIVTPYLSGGKAFFISRFLPGYFKVQLSKRH